MAANSPPALPPTAGPSWLAWLDHPRFAFLRSLNTLAVVGLILVVLLLYLKYGMGVGLPGAIPQAPTAAVLPTQISPPPASTPAASSSDTTTDPASLLDRQGMITPLGGEADVPAFWSPGGEEATRLPADTLVDLVARQGGDWVLVQNDFLAQPLWVTVEVVTAPNTNILSLPERMTRQAPVSQPPASQGAPPASGGQQAPGYITESQPVLPTATDLNTLPTAPADQGAPATTSPGLSECTHTGGGGMCPAAPIPTTDPNAGWPVTFPQQGQDQSSSASQDQGQSCSDGSCAAPTIPAANPNAGWPVTFPQGQGQP